MFYETKSKEDLEALVRQVVDKIKNSYGVGISLTRIKKQAETMIEERIEKELRSRMTDLNEKSLVDLVFVLQDMTRPEPLPEAVEVPVAHNVLEHVIEKNKPKKAKPKKNG